MKLATLINPEKRDGDLLVVSRDNRRAVRATSIVPTLREAVENWRDVHPKLLDLDRRLNQDLVQGAFEVNEESLHSPLPRSFQWADGSAFIHHVKLVRTARSAPLPENLEAVPLMYQGGSDDFLPPRAPIPQIDFGHGTDFEAEVAVITDDVPMGIDADSALQHIILFMLVNDVSLRGLIPGELDMGFGFFQSKPSSSFSPFAVTPDELGDAWRGGRVHLPLNVEYNGQFFGNPEAGAMHFHFGQLIAHAARTRNLRAGTIIGSGTVSNEDRSRGSCCIAEKRMLEKIHEGVIKTPFMKAGETVKIWMANARGENIFGTIMQTVQKHVASKDPSPGYPRLG